MATYEIFSLITGITIAVVLIFLTRNSKIHPFFFIWWAPIILFVIIFALAPSLINTIGRLLGISYPPIIISIVGIGLLLIKTLLTDIHNTRNDIRYKSLARKTALLEKKIHDLQKKMSGENE